MLNQGQWQSLSSSHNFDHSLLDAWKLSYCKANYFLSKKAWFSRSVILWGKPMTIKLPLECIILYLQHSHQSSLDIDWKIYRYIFSHGYSFFFFLFFVHLWWFGVWRFWGCGLGLGFRVALFSWRGFAIVVWAFWFFFWGLGSLYKHRRVNLGKDVGKYLGYLRYTGSQQYMSTIFPQCNLSMEFPEILSQNHYLCCDY